MSTSALTTARHVTASNHRPLVIDLDGSLVRTDTLIECVVAGLAHPLKLAKALFALRRGKAAMKAALADLAAPDPALLPYNPELLAFLRDEQKRGRPLILATAADRRIAFAVAEHLDLFDAVLASDSVVNLAGPAKLAAIKTALADRDFAYVGDEHRDLSVWREAAAAITVDAPPRLARAVAEVAPIERVFDAGISRGKALLRAMRPHQWLKNLLVFVPLVTARAIGDFAGWGEAALAFAAFSLTASGIYLVNDLCDLAADRQHPNKCNRPLASGALPLRTGLAVAPLLLLAGAAIGAGAGVFPVLALYAALSLGYSFHLKTQPLVDVFVLAALYTIRVIGGGIATGYTVSLWLLAFSSFLFLSLAMVKRVAELQALARRERRGPARLEAVGGRKVKVAGRGYLASDAHILELMGVAASFVTSLVLALYMQSAIMPVNDHRPTLAWGIVPLILFWQCRLWLVTARGEMHHDPILFAARDWVSWVVTAASFALLLFGTKVAMLPF
ncbi:MAG TPA: UbiA family prenyltransferase [Stellaceae bacterium]|nr:UbiA family prenyltransferase [Stellaceae bacterium]